MPDKDGRLSKEERQKIVDWLTEKKVLPHCPACGHENAFIGGHLVVTPMFGKGIVRGGETHSQVFTHCQNCSHVRYFLAVPIGIAPPSEKSEADSKEEKSATIVLLKRPVPANDSSN